MATCDWHFLDKSTGRGDKQFPTVDPLVIVTLQPLPDAAASPAGVSLQGGSVMRIYSATAERLVRTRSCWLVKQPVAFIARHGGGATIDKLNAIHAVAATIGTCARTFTLVGVLSQGFAQRSSGPWR